MGIFDGFKKSPSDENTDAGVWYEKGIALPSLGRDEESLVCFDKALAINPNSAYTWYCKGIALSNLGRDEESLVCFDKALAINPNSAYTWYCKGIALSNLGRDEESLVCFDKALAINPNSTNVWYWKGIALSRLGKHEESLVCFDKALAIDPNSAYTWHSKGIALSNLGRDEESLVYFDKALAIDRNSAYTWYWKSVVLSRLGRDEAEKCFARAKELGYKKYEKVIDEIYANAPIDDADLWTTKGVALAKLAQTRIQPDPEKIQYEISWPNIDRIEKIFSSKITLDINETKSLELKSNDFSLTVDMSGVISGKPVLETMSELDLAKLDAKIRIPWIIFQAAKQILPEIEQDWKGSPEDLMIQLVKIVEDFIESDKITVLNVDQSDEIRRKLIIAFNLTKIVKHIASEIKISNTQERKLVLNKEKPIKSTVDMQPWYTRKPNVPTLHSHINFTIYDSGWEADAIQELERNPQVESWAKNEHLGFKILYLFNGILHEYWPEYIVHLKNGITLILEIERKDFEKQLAIHEALKEWLEAVNEDGKFGVWSWDLAVDWRYVRSMIKRQH